MLIEWRAAILASDLKASARLVALVLSTHMDREGGSCFPSQELLAKETGHARSTVQLAIDAVERGGYLECDRHRGRVTHYRASWPTIGPLADEARAKSGPVIGPLVDQSPASTGPTIDPEDVLEDVTEDVQESSSSTRASDTKHDFDRLLAPIEQLDGYAVDGPGRVDLTRAFAESPEGFAKLTHRYRERGRLQKGVTSAGGALVAAVRHGDHREAAVRDGSRNAGPIRCPDCEIGGGLHAEGCPRAESAVGVRGDPARRSTTA
jgi:hypothetical protein